MANNEALAISAANLDVIENNLGQLANNIGQVTLNVQEVNTRVNDVTNSVKTIEDEIRNFMLEIRGTTVVGNAKQSILINQAELEKKYGHYDNVRRKINGILQATDISAIKKNTVSYLSEKTIIDTPNYWLAPCFVAIGAWLTNDQDLAKRSLKEAMNRDDEKTSLLLSLIHFRADRLATGIKWLNRFFSMQDPAHLERKMVTVIDAISSGVLGVEAKKICLDKINEWTQELSTNNVYSRIQIDRWKNYIMSYKGEVNIDEYNFIKEYTDALPHLESSLSLSSGKEKLFNEIKGILGAKELEVEKVKKIDKMIDTLISNYENEELELRREIAKEKAIIEENGNIEKAEKKFKEKETTLNDDIDFFSILTNIVIQNDSVNTSATTRKLALALSKEWFTTAYNETLADNSLAGDRDININIDYWSGITTTGSNEKELVDRLKSTKAILCNSELNNEHLFNFKMAISFLIGIIVTWLTIINSPIVAYSSLAVIVIYNIYQITTIMNKRKDIRNKNDLKLKDNYYLLTNVLAEIVDYKLLCQNGKTIDYDLINYIKNINYQDYIETNDVRNIMIGGNYGE